MALSVLRWRPDAAWASDVASGNSALHFLVAHGAPTDLLAALLLKDSYAREHLVARRGAEGAALSPPSLFERGGVGATPPPLVAGAPHAVRVLSLVGAVNRAGATPLHTAAALGFAPQAAYLLRAEEEAVAALRAAGVDCGGASHDAFVHVALTKRCSTLRRHAPLHSALVGLARVGAAFQAGLGREDAHARGGGLESAFASLALAEGAPPATRGAARSSIAALKSALGVVALLASIDPAVACAPLVAPRCADGTTAIPSVLPATMLEWVVVRRVARRLPARSARFTSCSPSLPPPPPPLPPSPLPTSPPHPPSRGADIPRRRSVARRGERARRFAWRRRRGERRGSRRKVPPPPPRGCVGDGVRGASEEKGAGGVGAPPERGRSALWSAWVGRSAYS